MMTPERIAEAYRSACRAELAALKPGNVHAFADGHRMTLRDFTISADVSAGPIAQAGAPVGKRVRDAVAATAAAVGQNTNLGIALLCAPLAAAAEAGGDIAAALRAILAGLDRQDAVDVYEAIRLAAPGGLGEADMHDVAQAPKVALGEAMAAAAPYDRIARAYVSDFEDLFRVGLPALAVARAKGADRPSATTAVYLAYLGTFPDTHVARKLGRAAAEDVRAQAAALLRAIDLLALPKAELLAFDGRLKAANINPGTSADFTVATLFLDAVSHGGPTARLAVKKGAV